MARKHHQKREYKNPDQMREATDTMVGVTKFAMVEQAGMSMMGMMSGLKP